LESYDYITLRGDLIGLNWNSGIKMTHIEANTWQLTLSVTTNQIGVCLEMKPLVGRDTIWSIGANFNVILPAQSGTIEVYPFFFVNQGQYKYVRNVYSSQLNNTRDLVIYTPPSYIENTLKTYSNILIMHDGQNLFNVSTSVFGVAWMCQDTVNALVNEGLMEEIIIIGVDNTIDRIDEYTYSVDPQYGGGKGNLYLNYLEDTVIPLVKSLYRIAPSAPFGILGSSLGGLISCYAGWTRSEKWPYAGCMSTSFWWNNQDFNNTVMLNYTAPLNTLVSYLDSGNAGPDNDDYNQTLTVTHHFESDGWKLNSTLFYYLDKGGQHSEYYWGGRFWVPMSYFYPIKPLTVI